MVPDRLQRWALFAEIAGAAAVVVTLGVLAVQMKSNTDALHAQTYQDLMSELNGYRTFLAQPQQLELRLQLDSVGWQGLTSYERLALRQAENIIWGIYESAYFSRERGVLGPEEFARFGAMICRRLTSEATQALWNDTGGTVYQGTMSDLLTPTFVDYVETTCTQ